DTGVNRPPQMLEERAEQTSIERGARMGLHDRAARRPARGLRVADAAQPRTRGQQRTGGAEVREEGTSALTAAHWGHASQDRSILRRREARRIPLPSGNVHALTKVPEVGLWALGFGLWALGFGFG